MLALPVMPISLTISWTIKKKHDSIKLSWEDEAALLRFWPLNIGMQLLLGTFLGWGSSILVFNGGVNQSLVGEPDHKANRWKYFPASDKFLQGFHEVNWGDALHSTITIQSERFIALAMHSIHCTSNSFNWLKWAGYQSYILLCILAHINNSNSYF